MTTARRLEYSDVDDLPPALRNPKAHNVDELRRSLRRFGFTQPILVDERTDRIVAGHGRVLALQAMAADGEDPPDGVQVYEGGTLDHPTAPRWLVPVIAGWRSADDAEAEAYLLADNQLTIAGGWDDGPLVALLADLQAGPGLEGVGFDPGDLDRLLANLDAERDRATRQAPDVDEVPEDLGEPVTRRGDLWTLGPHRVLCGDSHHAADVDRLLEAGRPAVVLTDPPYAIYGSASGIGSDIADDKMVRPFFESLLRTCRRVLPDFAHVYVHCDWRSYASLWEAARRAGLSPKNCIVWDKNGAGLGNNWANTHEFIAYFAKLPPPKAMTSNNKRGQRPVHKSNVLRYPRVSGDEREHNAAKPVAMLEEVIRATTDDGAIVLDLFGGSGSTLIAADRCGRTCFTMEIEPKECDKIVARWERITGRQATRTAPTAAELEATDAG